jgi:hypothetical protein
VKRIALFVILALSTFCCQSATAGPLDWAKHHKRFLLMEGAAITAASIHAAGLHHCRHYAGVEACDAHYGAAWGAYGFATGLTVVAMPAVAEGCWKSGQGKFCNLFAYGGSAVQAGWGLHEFSIKSKGTP